MARDTSQSSSRHAATTNGGEAEPPAWREETCVSRAGDSGANEDNNCGTESMAAGDGSGTIEGDAPIDYTAARAGRRLY